MGRGSKSAPGGKAPSNPPGPLGRLFLVFCRPLPEALSLHSVFSCIGACIGCAGQAVATLLVLTAPVSIPLLVWTALGADSSKRQVLRLPPQLPRIGSVNYSNAEVRLPALSAPAAFALLAAVSAAIHLAQISRQNSSRKREAAAVAALTPASAQRRPRLRQEPQVGMSTAKQESSQGGMQHIESPFSSHRRRSAHASPDGKTPRLGMVNGEAGGGGSGGVPVQQLFAQLAQVQHMLFGAGPAAQLAAGVPQTFENAVFEAGRLCGVVGIDPPPGGGGSPKALSQALTDLKAALA